MEYKIGEIFEDRGCWYQCLENNSCRCDYCDYGELGDCQKIACASGERSDDKEVHFKKLKKVGDPYLAHDHSRNKDVVVQDYKLYNQHACYNGHEEMLVFSYHGKGTVTIKTNEPIYKKIKEDMEEKKLNLKPFNIQKAREGKPVCTRGGRKARIISCSLRNKNFPIAAIVEDEEENVYQFEANGVCDEHDENLDLMMLPEKKEGWVNVYKDGDNNYRSTIYTNEKVALSRKGSDCITTIKIEWEE